MVLKTALVLVRRYLESTVVVILVLAGSMAYVWGEYKDVVRQREQLAAERKAFNDEVLASDKNRADLSHSLLERKTELDMREFVLQQREKENQGLSSDLQQKVAEYAALLEVAARVRNRKTR